MSASLAAGCREYRLQCTYLNPTLSWSKLPQQAQAYQCLKSASQLSICDFIMISTCISIPLMGQYMRTVVLWSEGFFFFFLHFFSIKTTGLQNENAQYNEYNLESNFMGCSTLMAIILGCQRIRTQFSASNFILRKLWYWAIHRVPCRLIPVFLLERRFKGNLNLLYI